MLCDKHAFAGFVFCYGLQFECLRNFHINVIFSNYYVDEMCFSTQYLLFSTLSEEYTIMLPHVSQHNVYRNKYRLLFKPPQLTWMFLIVVSTESRKLYIRFYTHLFVEERMRSDYGLVLKTGLPGIAVPPGATIASRSAVRIRINFWRMFGLYISFGDRADALECWRSPSLRLVKPVLQYLRKWPIPTVIIFDMSTVVKLQQPPPLIFSSTTFVYWTRRPR